MANSVCRLCRSNQNLQYMFDNTRRQIFESLRTIIFIASSVEIKETDIVSKAVCRRCCEIAVKLHKYRLSAVANDKLLKEQYGQPYVAPNINPNEILSIATRSSCDLGDFYSYHLSSTNILSNNDIGAFTDSSISEIKPTPTIKVEYKHPSVQELHKRYKGIVLPEQVFSSHVSPIILLDKNAISDWRKQQMNLLMKRIPGIAIKKVPVSSGSSNSVTNNGTSSISTSRFSDEKIKKKGKNIKKSSSGANSNTGTIKDTILNQETINEPNKNKNDLKRPKKSKKSAPKFNSLNKLSSSSRKRKLSTDNKNFPFKITKVFSTENSDNITSSTAPSTGESSRKVLSSSSSDISFDSNLQRSSGRRTPLIAEAGKEREIFICLFCSKIYYTKKGLRKHETTHLECKFCKEKFQDIISLNSHHNKSCFINIAKNSSTAKSIEIDNIPAPTGKCAQPSDEETRVPLKIKEKCPVEIESISLQANSSREENHQQENHRSDNYSRENLNIIPTVVDYSLDLEENSCESLKIDEEEEEEEAGSFGRCSSINEDSSSKDNFGDSTEQVVEVTKNKNVVKGNVDIIDVTNNSDQETEHTKFSRLTIIQNTETEHDGILPKPMSNVHSIASILNEKEILFNKQGYLPFVSDNSTQTTILSDDSVKYTQSGIVVIQGLSTDLSIYKIPISMALNSRINVTFKKEEPNSVNKKKESWLHKAYIGIRKAYKETKAEQILPDSRKSSGINDSFSNNANRKYSVQTSCSTDSNCTNLKSTSVVGKNESNFIAGYLATHVTPQTPTSTADIAQTPLQNVINSPSVQRTQQSNITTVPAATSTATVVTTAQTPSQTFGISCYVQKPQQPNVAVVPTPILTTVVTTTHSPLENYENSCSVEEPQQCNITTVPVVPSIFDC